MWCCILVESESGLKKLLGNTVCAAQEIAFHSKFEFECRWTSIFHSVSVQSVHTAFCCRLSERFSLSLNLNASGPLQFVRVQQ